MTNPSPATIPHNPSPSPSKQNTDKRKFSRNSRKRLTHKVADSLTTEQIVKLAIRYGDDPSQHPSRRKR